jgi:site-specific DNA recombinase
VRSAAGTFEKRQQAKVVSSCQTGHGAEAITLTAGASAIMAKDRYGCAAHRQKGTCVNTRTISRARIEARILGGLKERMLTPDLVAEFMRAFAEEMAQLHGMADASRARLERELGDIDRRLCKMMDAIESEGWHPSMRGRLTELEARKAAVADDLARAADPQPSVVLHPNAAEIYRQRVAELEIALAAPEIRTEAAEVLRSLIDRVVLTPDAEAPDGLRAELHGDLAQILALSETAEGANAPSAATGTGVPGRRSRSQLSVVAGARNHLDLLLTG